MTAERWCHLDLWADNLRGTPDGAACVIDFDSGSGDPSRELGMVLFEFARTDRERLHALATWTRRPGGSGRVTGRGLRPGHDRGLHYICRHHVLGWLNARDQEARARAHAGVEEFVGDPFLVGDVQRLVRWLRA